jgi:hypothetical protein
MYVMCTLPDLKKKISLLILYKWKIELLEEMAFIVMEKDFILASISFKIIPQNYLNHLNILIIYIRLFFKLE